MKEHSLIFRGEMVRAILNGQKTQTRRVIKPQPGTTITGAGRYGSTDASGFWKDEWSWLSGDQTDIDLVEFEGNFKTGYCEGDHAWVRETWADVNTENGPAILYRADQHYHWCSEDAYPVEYDRYPNCQFTMWCGDLLRGEPDHAWRRSIHMPRSLSRITLEITDVRIQRVRDISEEDAFHEGFNHKLVDDDVIHSGDHPSYSRENFRIYWNSLHGKDAWNANPWVVALTFRRLSP